MAVGGKTKHKTIGVKREVINIVYYVFFVTALVLIAFKIYLTKNNRLEEAETVEWLALGMVVGALVCRILQRFLPKSLGQKPTREEIEKTVHGE